MQWIRHSELTVQPLYVSLHNQDQTTTLCKLGQSNATQRSQINRNQIKLSNEAVLVKCDSRFCSFVASFFPQKFSKTFFSALLWDRLKNAAAVLKTAALTRSTA